MFKPRLCVGLLLSVAFMLSGCAATIPRNGISNGQLAETAEIPGMPGVRFWADEVPRNPLAEIRRRTAHMPPIARDAKMQDGRKVIDTLALSGGRMVRLVQAFLQAGRNAATVPNSRS